MISILNLPWHQLYDTIDATILDWRYNWDPTMPNRLQVRFVHKALDLPRITSVPAKRQTQRTTTFGGKPDNYEGGGAWWRTSAKVWVKAFYGYSKPNERVGNKQTWTGAQNLMKQEKHKKKPDKQYGSNYGQRSSFKVNNTKLDKWKQQTVWQVTKLKTKKIRSRHQNKVEVNRVTT